MILELVLFPGYLKEYFRVRQQLKPFLNSVPAEIRDCLPGIDETLNRYAMMGAVGVGFADLVGVTPEERIVAGEKAAGLMLLIQQFDDFIDERCKSQEEREMQASNVLTVLRGGHLNIDHPLYQLAELVRDRYLPKIGSRWDHLSSSVLSQFKTSDPCQLLKLEKMIAGVTYELLAKTAAPSATEGSIEFAALHHLGAGSQMLDNAHDLEVDAENGINTAGTVMLRGGASLQAIREFYFEQSKKEYRQGLRLLRGWKSQARYGLIELSSKGYYVRSLLALTNQTKTFKSV